MLQKYIVSFWRFRPWMLIFVNCVTERLDAEWWCCWSPDPRRREKMRHRARRTRWSRGPWRPWQPRRLRVRFCLSQSVTLAEDHLGNQHVHAGSWRPPLPRNTGVCVCVCFPSHVEVFHLKCQNCFSQKGLRLNLDPSGGFGVGNVSPLGEESSFYHHERETSAAWWSSCWTSSRLTGLLHSSRLYSVPVGICPGLMSK